MHSGSYRDAAKPITREGLTNYSRSPSVHNERRFPTPAYHRHHHSFPSPTSHSTKTPIEPTVISQTIPQHTDAGLQEEMNIRRRQFNIMQALISREKLFLMMRMLSHFLRISQAVCIVVHWQIWWKCWPIWSHYCIQLHPCHQLSSPAKCTLPFHSNRIGLSLVPTSTTGHHPLLGPAMCRLQNQVRYFKYLCYHG